MEKANLNVDGGTALLSLRLGRGRKWSLVNYYVVTGVLLLCGISTYLRGVLPGYQRQVATMTPARELDGLEYDWFSVSAPSTSVVLLPI